MLVNTVVSLMARISFWYALVTPKCPKEKANWLKYLGMYIVCDKRACNFGGKVTNLFRISIT